MAKKKQWENRLIELENKVAHLECMQGIHDLQFYNIGESTIVGNYWIQYVCKKCRKIFQQDLNREQKKILKIAESEDPKGVE